ncbi:hypothetical protein N8E89_06355 [Phyllobacterium sp. A18/5-2]|nr:hypothetical protein [Phyllobacterium sp. A18/5-2]UXN65298.1 hypothetical protein N8E89_06355 [Phyllobacterium sp. A18/5-2]
MALGFIKKIFSFGKKEVEEVPVEETSTVPDTSPTVEQGYEDTTAQEALPDTVETVPAAAEPVESQATYSEPESVLVDLAQEPEILPEIEPVIVEPVEIEIVPVEISSRGRDRNGTLAGTNRRAG